MLDSTHAHVTPDTPIIDVIKVINASSLQVALVVDPDNKLLGTVTDGDVRRGILKSIPLTDPASAIMNPDPIAADQGDSRTRVLAMMRQRRISQIPVIDTDGRVLGLQVLGELSGPRDRDNWVVIQAGGLGSRLSPLTDACPKPLLNVGDRPLLESIIEKFVDAGFRRFFISVGYLAEMVERHFGDGDRYGVRIEYLREHEPLGTAGSLSLLPGRPSLPLIVMNGDLLTQVNFAQMLDFHDQQAAVATMGVREYDYQVPFGVVELEEHRLLALEEKPVKRCFVNAGVYVLSPTVLTCIDPGERIDMTTVFRRLIERDDLTAVFPIREYWRDIGRRDDLKSANLEYPEHFSAPAPASPLHVTPPR